MTTVEELREALEKAINDAEEDETMEFAVWPIVDALIAAAREEGAEQMKAEIRTEGDFIATDVTMESKFSSATMNRFQLTGVTADIDLYIVPASLLSPAPKEPEVKK